MPKRKSEFDQLKTLDSKRKSVLFTVMLILFGIGFFAGSYYSVIKKAKKAIIPLTTKIKLQPTTTPIPATTLVLSPAYKKLNIGGTFPLSVVISGEKVQATDIVLRFDPKYFSASNIVKGEAFPLELKKEIEEDKIIFSSSLDPTVEVTPKSSSGIVFSVDLTTLSATPSTIIDFDSSSTVTAKDGNNTLGLAVGGKYKIEQ